ncbi:unnamed protein product [Moneuplotes crassus]|uniref:Uncharacterized protein n=1 Tax=Euplotes crassus TaxID=5936 RepID=A0AAD1U6H1_EUPCR|nr:unnamed protein product [Moneuplotes crassus]
MDEPYNPDAPYAPVNEADIKQEPVIQQPEQIFTHPQPAHQPPQPRVSSATPLMNPDRREYNPHDRPLVPEQNPMAKKIWEGYEWGILILALVNLVAGYLSYSSVSGFSSSMIDFKANWDLQPIVDIKTALNGCPPGYEDLINEEWPGTIEGCDCRRAWGVYKDLYSSSCTYNQTRDDCRTVPRLSPMPIKKFYSYRICGKRQGEPFYMSESPYTKFASTECPQGYKICGGDDPDTQTCVRENHQCPINDVIITDSSLDVPSGYKSIQLDSGMILAFTNSSTHRTNSIKSAGLPIVRFKLVEGQVCAEPSQEATTEGRFLYQLLNKYSYACWTEVAGSKTDPRYKKVASIKENRLYEDNGISYVTVNLPMYDRSKEFIYDWNLYSQTYITWSPGCDSNDKINKEHILEQAVGSVGVASSLFTTFIISIVFFIVSVIFVCTHECRKSEADGYEVKKHTNVELLCVSVKIVFASIIIWLCYKSISVINSYTSSVGQIGKSKCSDNYTNEIFLSFSKALVS